MHRSFIAIVLVAAAALTFAGAAASAAHAETAAELQHKLRDARGKIDAAKKKKASLGEQIAGLDGKLTAIQGRLDSLGDQIASVEERLSVTREKLAVLRKELRLKRRELEEAKAELEREQRNFQERVVLSYKSDDLDYVDVMLASSSFEDLISRVNVIHDLLGGNDELVGSLEAARDEVDAEKRAIAKREGAVADAATILQEKSDELAALRAAQAASQAAALAVRKQKSGALKGVKKDLAELERQENQLLAESAALADVIAGSSGSGTGSGSLSWPVSGPITSPFGWRIHPILRYRKFHTGLDFGVGYGTPIRASDGGTVIYATWMGGYGNVIIIDHGNGLSTLYAHQSSLAMGTGARVTRGQTVGYVGSTGFSTGPHLHFEVRVNGNPVDPMGYL
ncbi:MAG TPA: peptidoglycan DD-metalloendopeptidase family protein [Thermoleophilia bacterium]|nr:peptidoglycan DD-metalloendopeptidase family protein [Thermoleophilia bacterium]